MIRRRGWIVVICLVAGAAAAGAIARNSTKLYTARASLLFQASQLDERLFGTSYTPAYVDPQTQAQTNLDLVSLPVVADLTSKALGGNPTAHSIADSLGTAADGTSELVTVTLSNSSPTEAAKIANAYVTAFVAYRRAAEQAQATEAATLIRQQLASLKATPSNSAQISLLQQRIQQLQALASLQTGDVQVAQPASVPLAASSPKTKEDIVLGAIAGLLVGVLGVLLAERLDVTLRDEDDVRDAFDVPLLTSLPLSRGFSRGPGAQTLAPFDGKVFRLLRNQLRYFNVKGQIVSVLVTSAAPFDGKSTVAWHLARAAAELAPKSQVLRLEADLRRPVLAGVAGARPSPGLSELLSQVSTLEEVTQRVAVQPSPAVPPPTLHLITAGITPPNPGELLGSERMRALLARLEAEYDFIVIDAPPSSLVADAIPLLTQVSGVLVVARLRNTKRAAARALSRQLAELRAPTLGLVLNGVQRPQASYGGYGGYGVYDGADLSADNPYGPISVSAVDDSE